MGHFSRLCSSIALFDGSENPILWIIGALLRFVGNVHVIIKKLGEFYRGLLGARETKIFNTSLMTDVVEILLMGVISETKVLTWI